MKITEAYIIILCIPFTYCERKNAIGFCHTKKIIFFSFDEPITFDTFNIQSP